MNHPCKPKEGGKTIPDAPEGFDQKAWRREYMRPYMRAWRRKKKEERANAQKSDGQD